MKKPIIHISGPPKSGRTDLAKTITGRLTEQKISWVMYDGGDEQSYGEAPHIKVIVMGEIDKEPPPMPEEVIQEEKKLLELINTEPGLTSLLYDLNLLPEVIMSQNEAAQIPMRSGGAWRKMILIAMHWGAFNAKKSPDVNG